MWTGTRLATFRIDPSRHRLRVGLVVALYALVAAGWLGVADWVQHPEAPDAGGPWILGAALDGAFVVVTAALLWHLLMRHQARSGHAESRVELLARRSPDMIFRYRVHPDPGYEYVSPAAEAISGYPVDDFYRHADMPLQLVHPDDRERLFRQMERPESIDETEELRWIRRDGSTVWVELKSHLVRDESGRPVALEGIVRDVTDRREGEQRRRILEAAAEAASDSILITDAEGRIEYVNPAFSRITGWERDEVIGRNPRILKSGHQDEAFYRRMWRTLAAGRAFQARFVNRRTDGGLYTQEAVITPVRGASGRIQHYVDVARDVTERDLLERHLGEARRAHLVGQVVGGVSHDFRNLLGIVRVQVDLAGDARSEGRFPADELEEIGRATERGITLVRRLLTLGRSEGVERAPLSLAEVVEGLRPALRSVLPESISLEIRVPEDDPMIVVADRGSLEQIIVNLATNARDALPRGGRVELALDRVDEVQVGPGDVVVGRRTRFPGDSVRLRFEDDGTGMDASTLQRAFEPFFTTKPEDRGTGLGMPMVARMTGLNGGTLTMSSRPGEGTVVCLHLVPSEEAAGTVPEEPDDEASFPRGRGESVLVAEDEGPLRKAQVRALERLGYRAFGARDGEEALRILEERGTGIDLVMSDLVMPGRGGKELFEEMGVLGLRDVPIIFMSGYSAADVVGSLPAAGDSYFLEKPWSMGQLARKVADALGAR